MPGAELRHRPLRARIVRGGDLGHRQLQLERVHAKLGLDLKAPRQHRKRLHEPPREHAVARENIAEGRVEGQSEEARKQPVSGAMTEAVGRVLLINARPDHHVETLFGETRDHGARARGIVGGVTIDQNVEVRVDVGEHSPHHVALALMPFAPHQRAGGAGNLAGAVGGVVVVDVDRGLGQRGAEIVDHRADGRLLVEARHQDRHALAGVRPPVPGTHRNRFHQLASFETAREDVHLSHLPRHHSVSMLSRPRVRDPFRSTSLGCHRPV